jgi:ClpP class serine protease
VAGEAQEKENSFENIFNEFNEAFALAQKESQEQGKPPVVNLDSITQNHLDSLFQYTQRPILVYVVDFFNAPKAQLAANEISIILSDKDGIVDATRKLPAGPLDVIIHSPGGSLEATESIVDILRLKFSDIRFFVPNTAKSAATMLALSGDEIFLASSAELGPIDPQIVLRGANGGVNQSPAQAIIDQFEAAQKDLASNPNKLPAWIPILPMYGPSLYQDSKNACSKRCQRRVIEHIRLIELLNTSQIISC